MFSVFVFIKKKIYKNLNIKFSLKINKNNKIIQVKINSLSDIFVFREIFINEDYNLKDILIEKDNIETIFDVGANVGFSSLYFHSLFPRAKIYSFEPDPNTFEKLKQNVFDIKNIKIFNFAVSDTNGVVKFFSNVNSASSSMDRRSCEDKEIVVKTFTLDNILQRENLNSVDLLKFDVEGAEEKVFKSIKKIKNFRYIIGEVHLDLMKQTEKDFLENFSVFSLNKEIISKKRFLLKGFRK